MVAQYPKYCPNLHITFSQDQITASILHRGKKLNKHIVSFVHLGDSTVKHCLCQFGCFLGHMFKASLYQFDQFFVGLTNLVNRFLDGSPNLHAYLLSLSAYLNLPSFDIIVEAL